MIVFRDHTRNTSHQAMLAELGTHFLRLLTNPRDQESARDLLLRFGEMETAWSDRIDRHHDSHNALLAFLRRWALSIGAIFCFSYAEQWDHIGPAARALYRDLDRLIALPLPPLERTRIPEGYAYYGFYPEMYVEAAQRFFAALKPSRAVCIGIRSIGTSLSAAVGARLRILGCRTEAYTVRPRGHPFDRHLSMSRSLTLRWRLETDAHFVVVDEGPGLSGSSFRSVAAALSGLGIPDRQIVFLPSWDPDPESMSLVSARECWKRHRKFVVSFEDVWLQERRIRSHFHCDRVVDISAGKWRSFVAPSAVLPLTQPSFERRKFLCLSGKQAVLEPKQLIQHLRTSNKGVHWAKFAGIGLYGRPLYKRAIKLWQGGFAPQTFEFSNGFLLQEFMPGRRLEPGRCRGTFLNKTAGYLRFLAEQFPASQEHAPTEIPEMIKENVYEGLGRGWCSRASKILETTRLFERYRATAIDGRMFPHEWIEIGADYIKTDGIEHHADHFFPGCQSILWDLAGVVVEFELSRPQRSALLALSGPLCPKTGQDLSFYEVAYLAFRLGYCIMAGQSLSRTPDGRRFESQSRRYASLLKERIAGLEKTIG